MRRIRAISKQEVPTLPSLDKPPHNQQAPEEAWQVIHQIADLRAQQMQNVFMESVQTVEENANVDEIEAGLANGDVNQSWNAIEWTALAYGMLRLQGISAQILRESGNRMQQFLPPEYGGGFREVNPRISQFLNVQTAQITDDIQRRSELAIFHSLRRAVAIGYTPRLAGRLISKMVGLTQRQAQAVDNYRLRMSAEGVRPERAYRMAGEYADRQREYRAQRIASTESMRSANFGWMEAITQAKNNGLTGASMVWIVTPDDRLCEYCKPMDGVEIPVGERFRTPLGDIAAPPMHVACRCSIEFRHYRV